MNPWQRLDAIIGRVETILLVTLLSLMMALAFTQIVLRNFLSTGLSWGDSMVRYQVLWLGIIGASLAVREGKHITIVLFPQSMGRTGRRIALSITESFAAVVCALLTYAASTFVRVEMLMAGTVFWGLPSWIPQLIMPVAFGIMTFRFAMRSAAAIAGVHPALPEQTAPGKP